MVEIILTIAMIVLGCLSIWLKGNQELYRQAAYFIKVAEAMAAKTGAQKMAWVVEEIKAFLPFLPRKIIQDSVQMVFDSVKDYAKMQLEKQINKFDT